MNNKEMIINVLYELEEINRWVHEHRRDWYEYYHISEKINKHYTNNMEALRELMSLPNPDAFDYAYEKYTILLEKMYHYDCDVVVEKEWFGLDQEFYPEYVETTLKQIINYIEYWRTYSKLYGFGIKI